MSQDTEVPKIKQQDVTFVDPDVVAQRQKLEDMNRRIAEREKQRQLDEEKERGRLKPDEKIKILLLGTRHLASHILFDMRRLAMFTVVDQRDPLEIFKNPLVDKDVKKSDVQMIQLSRLDSERSLEKVLRGGDFDFIFNTIAVHDAIFSNMNPLDTHETNVMFTQRLMSAIINSSTNAPLIHISTDKVYGDQGCPAGLGGGRFDGMATQDINAYEWQEERYYSKFKIIERDRPEPKGVRAISRYCQEQIISGMCKTYGVKHMILRVANMFGRWTAPNGVINQMIADALRTRTINVYGDKWTSRDFINIEEVAHLIKRISVTEFDPSVWNEVYNIGGMYPTRQYIEGLAMFIQTMCSGNPVRGLSPNYEQYLLPFGSVKLRYMPPRCYEDTEEAGIRVWLDCTKAKEKLKYDPNGEGTTEWEIVAKETFLWVCAYVLHMPYEEVLENKMKLQA